MNTFRNLVLFILAGAVMAGCNKVSYRKTAGGMPYKVYPGSGGKDIRSGYFVKVNLTQKIKDSIYFTTEGKLPIYLRVNDVAQPYDVSEVWIKVKTGDSIITTQMMDTFIKRSPANVPPQFRNGDRIETFIKILEVFTSDSLTRADEEKGKKEMLAVETKAVEKYIADKKVVAQKTPSGAYIEILNPGTGDSVTVGKYISINYTGRTFAGVKFDSNTDSSFHHMEPYSFVAGVNQMIKGFDEGLLYLKKGGSGRVYVPSMLGYGPNPTSPLIKPFENLVFDVTIVEVKDKAPEVPQQGLVPPRRTDGAPQGN